MDKRIYSGAGLALVAIAFLVFALFNNIVFSGVKLDLTENGLYTLSEGTRKIVEDIDEPINLYFFFSEEASQDFTALRAYAQRVEELLRQYESLGDGSINLRIIDPEPFSEAEDRAAAFGLQSVPVNGGNDLYFGLAGTNALDDQDVIEFFQPDKEEFLEYEISRLIQTLANPDRPVVGLMSSIRIRGDVDMQTFQTTPAWVVVEQLGEQFEIRNVETSSTELPDDLDLLIIVHPKDLSEDTLFAIDQFAMAGGRILVFVDPVAEQDRPAQQGPMMPPPGGRASDLNTLLSAWGVTLRDGVFIGDAQAALQVSGGPSGRPVRHFGILGLERENFSTQDVVTAPLANINVSTAGILDIDDAASTTITPLIRSSEYAMPLDVMQLQMMTSPEDLQKGFAPTGERYLIAARIEGAASSAFPDGLDDDAAVMAETDDLNVIVAADTDMLSDRLWVSVQNFLGQRIASPFANNGDFVYNAVDNLVGSPALISVRSRGRFTRPFDVVQDLRREAEARYLESANDLQARLSETERKLSELESQREEKNLLSLSPEQEAALERFQQEKVRIRKQLRDVRHQLDRDIEALGTALKFLNIFLVPLLLTLGLLMIHYVRMRKEGE